MNDEIAKKWLKQAFHDLEMAEKNIQIRGYDIAAFLSHQSVEKLFKALFAMEGKRIPKTHYIDEMARQMGIPEEIMPDINDLTADYVFSRYPDAGANVPFEEYNETNACEKVNSAKRIFKTLEGKYSRLRQENDEG